MMRDSWRWREVRGAMVTVVILTLAGVTAGLLGWFFYSLDTPPGIMIVQNFIVKFSNHRQVNLLSPVNDLPLLSGVLGTTLPQPSIDYKVRASNETFVSVSMNNIDFSVRFQDNENKHIYWIEWLTNTPNTTIQDCYSLSNAIWFAAPFVDGQPWPLSKMNISDHPVVPGSGIRERYWVSSAGTAILVNWDTPLQVSINASSSNLFCLKSTNAGTNRPLRLTYTILLGPDINQVYSLSVINLPRPTSIPEKILFENPSWTTNRLQYTGDFLLEHFIRDINANGFSGSLLLFDSSYLDGSRVDSSVMPDVLGTELHSIERYGVCPTVVLSNFDLLMQKLNETKPGKLNEQHLFHIFMRHLRETLRKLQEKEICSVSLDIPEEMFNDIAHEVLVHKLFIGAANTTAHMFKNAILPWAVSVQWLPNFVPMSDRSWTWDSNRGLQSILPEAFSIGMAGYPFIMAPGLEASEQRSTGVDAELYIRWMQLVTFFPAVRFSYPPWMMSREVAGHVHHLLNLRKSFIPLFTRWSEAATHSGLPVIRPMWMSNSRDPAVFFINDQFTIGDEMLVAPVVTRDTSSEVTRRDIYLPPGQWYSHLHNQQVNGGQWLRGFNATLWQLPYFTKITPPTSDHI